MKVCSECGKEKEKEEFSKNKNSKDGLSYWCKVCCKEYYKNNGDKRKEYLKNNKDRIKEYNEKNKDKIKDKKKEYYENNKDKIKDKKKEYNENNKDRRKKYYENNKDKIKEYGKEYRRDNKDRIRDYYENNGDKKRKYSREWYRDNIDKTREHFKSPAQYNILAHQISYAEPTRRDPENEELLQVKCTYCGKWFNPTIRSTRNRIAALEGKGSGEQRLYCSDDCKNNCSIYGQIKYPKYYKKDYNREVQSELRDLVFERDEWTCIKCGETVGLQCHHIEGIQWNPIESADIDICVTFCVKCHEEAHKDKGCRYYDLQCRN